MSETSVLGYGILLLFALVAGVLLGRRWPQRATLQPSAPPLLLAKGADLESLPTRLHELDAAFAPFGSNAAHPSALLANAQFREAVELLASPDAPLDFVLQYAEGANWGLSCAALAALKERADRGKAVERVELHCEKLAAWAMYFALEFLVEVAPRVPVGAPAVGAKDWWAENPFMPNLFRDYFAKREAQGDAATFGPSLNLPTASPHPVIRAFLQRVNHPFAAKLIGEVDAQRRAAAAPNAGVLSSIGRYWDGDEETELLVEPRGWREPFDVAEATLRQSPPRSLLVAGESLVGKTSFLRLLADRVEGSGWSVFEAGGADLQAGQIYIGQLEERIRAVVQELDASRRMIWYIPDIVQLARSGTHQGQSASMLEQIMPAIVAGRLVVWCEATPTSAARLLQLRPSLRGVLEIIELAPLSADETLTLARELVGELAEKADMRFHPDCAEVALDTARQYLGTAGLPGSALLMLKLTATRAQTAGKEVAPRQVLEMLSQLSGLPVSILDTKERIDLDSIRAFFRARVIGQDEAVETIVQRVAMLKAGLNDPGRPIGVFLFAGPTGTGKTELAKAVADFLFGSVERLIRLDMSEFQTPESLGKILGQSGAPMEADSLIQRVRKQPFSTLLLDEFEKSHPMIWDLFLQVFDEGRLTDAMGQTADFRHCLIILTSNLGAAAHRTMGLGFAPQADEFTAEQIMRAIAQTYRPEFQNRLDKVIVFRPLTRALMRGILKKELSALLDRRGLKDRAWAIEWESSALEFLLQKGFSAEMGARPLKRAIDQYVIAPFAALIVEKRFPEGDQFVFVRSDGQAIQADFVDPDADEVDARAIESAPAGPPPALAAIILAPAGAHAEHQALEGEYAQIAQRLASEAWDRLKTELAEDLSTPEFWNRPDRFDTLARFALMDRVKAAMETAQALRARLSRASRGPRPYSPPLIARLALQLHLIKEGVQDVFDHAPVEAALAVEPVFAANGDKEATREWRRRLIAMYRSWSEKRRMQASELRRPGDDAPTLLISGFGACRMLAREAGLHVLDLPDAEGSRVTARVRVAPAPLGEDSPAKERSAVIVALDATPTPNAIVRRYRDDPPLVRSGDGKWRTGRLDLVLGGDFDLLEAAQP